MAERQRVRIPFGAGLDRDTGALAVGQGSMEDLRNFYLRNGRLAVRKGVFDRLQFTDTDGNPVTHLLAGQPIRGLRIGLVVGYQGDDTVADAGKVFIYRTDADATIQKTLVYGNDPANPEWFTVTNPASAKPPTIVTAEAESKAFFAHSTFAQADRKPTLVYDTQTGPDLQTIDLDLNGDGTKSPVRFRGVASHLDYLFGWGYGTATEARPELLRVSLPGAPKRFDPNHYFIVGDRRNPVVAAAPAGANLIALKENEVHTVSGTGRHNFGIQKVDSHFGCVAPRLAITVSGTVFVWATDGPRITDGGPTQRVSSALDLEGFDPSGLVARDNVEDGFAAYVPEEQVVVFCFGKRVYALTLRRESRGWSYWELPFNAESGFSLYGAERGAQSTDPPDSNSDFTGKATTPKSDTSVELEFNNEKIEGDELIEIWRRPVANHVWPEWLDEPTGSNVADGWSSGGAATANYSLDDTDGDGDPDRQQIEVTGGASGEQAYIEKTITGLSAGDTWRISSHYIVQNLTDLEGRIQIAWLQSDDTVISTTNLTGLAASADGGIRAYIEEAAPANTAKIRVRLILHVTGSSPSGSIFFRRVLVHNDTDDPAWDRYDTISASLTGSTPQTVLVDGNDAGWFYEFALRHRRAGQYPSAYDNATPADPNTWPEEAKALGKNTVTVPVVQEVGWERTGGTEETAYVVTDIKMDYTHELWVDGSQVLDIASGKKGFQVTSEVTNPDISGETEHSFSAAVKHPDGVQRNEGPSVARWMGPVQPKIEQWYPGNTSGTVYWSIEEGNPDAGRVDDSEVASELADSVDGLGTVDNTTSEGVETGDVSYASQPDGTDITVGVKHKVTKFEVADYSRQVTATAAVGSGGL